jgi:hypothetical protein
MTVSPLHRCEPTFGHAPHADEPGGPQPMGDAAPGPAGTPSESCPDGMPGHGPALALPWIGLAAASLLLALPVLAAGRVPGASAAPVQPAGERQVRLADEDEVAFGRFTLRLGGASSSDELWRRWTDLKQKNLGLLDDLSPAVRPIGAPGAGFALLVGDFRNAATAADACGVLRARFLGCEVVSHDGSVSKPQA